MRVKLKECKLGDVLEFKRGYDLPKKSRVDGIVPIISSSGVSGFHNEAKAKAPGVVTGRYGTLGEVFYVDEDYWPLNTALYVKDFKGNYPRYIKYFLERLDIAELNAAGAVPGLNRNHLHMLDVRVIEDYEAQKHVSNTLENYDNLIENNNRRIQILETIAQKLYQEWFIHYRFPGHAQAQWRETEQGKIPAGWEVRCIKDFGEIITGKTPSKRKPENYRSRDVQFIKTPDMHNGVYVLETSEMLSEVGASSQKTKFIPVGSLMVSCIGTAGVVAINTERAQTNQQINTIVLNDEFAREFLYFALLGLKQTIINHGSTGATMTNLSKGKFEALEVTTPSTKLIEKFSHRVKPMFNQMLLLMKKNKNLQKQRDLLLPKLISK